MERVNDRTKRIALCAVFTAAALVLSLVERWIPSPVPVPGVKLGLSNVAVLLGLYLLGPGSALWILVGKCLLSAVLAGSVSGALYSVTGGVIAFVIMLLAIRIKKLSPVGVSVLGSAGHVTGQIAVSMVLMGTWVTVNYLPVLLFCAAVSGGITGLISSWLLRALNRLYR